MGAAAAHGYGVLSSIQEPLPARDADLARSAPTRVKGTQALLWTARTSTAPSPGSVTNLALNARPLDGLVLSNLLPSRIPEALDMNSVTWAGCRHDLFEAPSGPFKECFELAT